MPAATGDLTSFSARDLIGSAGIGEYGEKLAATLDTAYPERLKAAQLRRVNQKLTAKLTESDWKAAASLAGVPSLAGLKVRGGELNPSEAVAVYSWLDEHGQVWRGCFPYTDVGKKSSDDHFAMRDAMAASPAARDLAESREKADADAPDVDGDVVMVPADPIAEYDDLKVEEVREYLDEHPDRFEVVKALEVALNGDQARKGVLEWEPRPAEPAAGEQSS